MFNLKIKKLSIIAGVVASAITLSAFSGFTTGLPTQPLEEQIFGISNEVSSLREQKVDDSVNGKIIEDSSPQVIDLDKPGDYRLVGAQAAANTSKNQDPNIRIVHINDVIRISGSGEYNITLDNVNIDIDDEDLSPIHTWRKADVNLILVGKNYLKNSSDRPYAGSPDATLKVYSSLTIGASGEGASLDVYGRKNAIYGENIIINSGDIKANSENSDVMYSNYNMTINGGNIEATSEKGHAIYVKNNMTVNGGDIEVSNEGCRAINIGSTLTINGGSIKATSKNSHAIYGGTSIIISDGDIKATSKNSHAIHGGISIIINGGDIEATSDSTAIRSWGNITINGGDIEATSENDNAIYGGTSIIISDGDIKATSKNSHAIHGGTSIIINGGKIKATSDSMAIRSWGNITINGGGIKATSVNKDAIYSQEDITINSGNIEATSEKGKAICGKNVIIKGGKTTSNFIKADKSLKMDNGIFDISEIESKNITIKAGDISKIKSINGTKYDFENSEYSLPLYIVDTKGKYINNENNILENLWGAFKKSNNSESNKSKKTNSYFSDCQFVFN